MATRIWRRASCARISQVRRARGCSGRLPSARNCQPDATGCARSSPMQITTRQRPATVSGLRPHRAGSPHVVAQEPCVDTLLADPALYSARLDYPAELIRSGHLYARTQTNNQCAADSRNGGMVCPRDCVNPSSREAIFPTGNRCPRLTDFGLPPTAQRRKRGCSMTSFRLKLRDMDCQLRPPDTGYSATATVDPGATRRPCRGRP